MERLDAILLESTGLDAIFVGSDVELINHLSSELGVQVTISGDPGITYHLSGVVGEIETIEGLPSNTVDMTSDIFRDVIFFMQRITKKGFIRVTKSGAIRITRRTT